MAHASGNLWPKMARVRLARTRSRVTEGLARVAAAHDVNGFDGRPVDRSDVSITGHLRPVFREDGAGVGVDLALPRNRHSRALKSEIESADPAKQ
jgi:hypothetical protein